MTEEKCADDSLQTGGTPPEVCLSARLAAKILKLFRPNLERRDINGQK
jgi:hypothetical protein